MMKNMGITERDLPVLKTIMMDLGTEYLTRPPNASEFLIGQISIPIDKFRTQIADGETIFQMNSALLELFGEFVHHLKKAQAARWN